MELALDEAVAVLGRTPGTLDALLRGLGPGWTRLTEGEGTWSPVEVVGHLLDAERVNWLPRLEAILGGDGAFAPFDRFGHLDTYRSQMLDDLLDAFTAERARSLYTLAGLGLSPTDLERRGQHPDLGAVTAGQLISTWVVHDLDHLVQVARTMAAGYAGAVGPWRAYLRVLRGSS